MDSTKCYEDYPLWIVLVSNLLTFSIYLIGAYILYQLGLVWLVLYLAYALFLEIRVLQKSCPDCYYFGKTCAFGKGRLAPALSRKGSAKFSDRQITWKDVLPDFLVSLIPMIVAIGLLVMNFSWLMLALLISLLLLGFVGTAFVRGQLACNHCKQRELGCPAERLFSKKNG
ncbi:Uncharacterised protein [uncultured archaeon]|nr:Uncharacterised protein [uncultured archaeon]